MILPKTELRTFKTDTLDNGIKIVYLHDKELDKTTVSVAVNVGSYANPDDCNGLAHFLEHMLFLGSKKYPEEDYYNINIKKYGGYSNAFTDMFNTVYHFSAFNNGIEHIMDIFAQFFIEPTFDKNSVEREINAVNSEHLKNVNIDGWRINQVLKNVALANNPFNTFTTGSNDTFNIKTVRTKMIEFYKKYYVSKNISICIISSMTIKEQQKLIRHTFNKIPFKDDPVIDILKPVYNKFDKTYQIIPIADMQQLIYTWEISNDVIYKENKLFHVFANLLSSKYTNSLSNFLKINGLIESLAINIDEDIGLFQLCIDLTKTGLSKLETIDGHVKYAINKILNTSWTNIVNYYQKVYELNFNFMDKEDATDMAINMSINLHNYKSNDIYSGPYLISKLETHLKQDFRSYFNNHFKILVSAKGDTANFNTDKYYGTKYGEIENIDNPEIPFDLSINIENTYLETSSPEFIKIADDIKTPQLLKNRFWYAGISSFGELTITGDLIFNNSKFFNSPRNNLLTSLAISCLNF